MNLNTLRDDQKKLRKKLVLFGDAKERRFVGGCDCTYVGDKGIFTIIIVDYFTKTIIEKKSLVKAAEMHHHPEYDGYRDVPGFLEVYGMLKQVPDILLIDGPGIMHPRSMGIASHLGLVLQKPTIGISKKISFGDLRGDDIIFEKEIIGKVIHTKNDAKPIYVSQGNLISLRASIEIVQYFLVGNKLPYPLHEAHKQGVKEKHKKFE